MPELPEVETMRRGIDAAIGTRIETVERIACSRKPISITPSFAGLRRRAEGARIERTDRAGKRVVLWLDTGDAIVFEPRMTGLVLRVDPPTREHLRLRFQLSGGCLAGRNARKLLYWDRRGLGSVQLYSTRGFERRFTNILGPDALTITAEQYREKLRDSKRAIKVGLLDQSAVAGIGNLYAAEILHVAGIHPLRRCNRMTRRQWAALADATHTVLNEAIRYEGSTLSDGTYRNALNKAGGYQNQHRVYDKTGQRCRRCRSAVIERIVQAQRSTFFCPKCQTRNGAQS